MAHLKTNWHRAETRELLHDLAPRVEALLAQPTIPARSSLAQLFAGRDGDVDKATVAELLALFLRGRRIGVASWHSTKLLGDADVDGDGPSVGPEMCWQRTPAIGYLYLE